METRTAADTPRAITTTTATAGIRTLRRGRGTGLLRGSLEMSTLAELVQAPATEPLWTEMYRRYIVNTSILEVCAR
jgi:hypothetical protein